MILPQRFYRPLIVLAAIIIAIFSSSASRAQVLSTVGQLYAPTSSWNLPIPVGASVDPNSAAMAQSVVTAGGQTQGFVIAVKKYTRPIYFAPVGTPVYTVSLTASWAAYHAIFGVPIPSNAQPDSGGDGHLTIIDPATACEYDFWQAAKQSDGSWKASWANATSTLGNGWLPVSVTGSGAAGAAGVMLPEEFQAGVINHALAFSYPFTKAGGPVLPATESDGSSTVAGAIPEGAHLQLDPALDLASLGLKPYELIIARAMQQYGLFLMDTTTGGIAFYAQNAQSTTLTYPWGDQTYVSLPPVLLSRLRVLTLGPQYKQSNNIEPTMCASFTSSSPTATVATPTINPPGGLSYSPLTVSLDDATPGAAIHFTTDGSTPSTSSPLYAGAFVLTASATLKAKAFSSGMLDSAVGQASFQIQDTTPPTVAITSPANGAHIQGTSQSSATASDNVKMVSVTFLLDGIAIGTDTSGPYTTRFRTNTAGAHVLTAIATDGAGNQASNSITVYR